MEYNSALLETGPLAVGWGHNFEMRVDVNGASGLIFNWNHNRRNYFTQVGTGNTYTCSDRAMIHDVLIKNGGGTYTLQRADQSRMQFNASGQLVQTVNPHGQALNLTYSADGTVPVAITEAISGRSLSLAYDSNGRVTTVTDPLSRQIVFTYDSSDHLTQIAVRNAASQNAAQFVYTYDKTGRILTGKDLEQRVFVTNTYDNTNRVSTQDDARTDNQLTRFEYDDESTPGSLIVHITDRNGKTSVNTFNTNYELVSVQNANGQTTFRTYDASGNTTSVKDPLGRTTSYTYDASGNLLTATDPALAVTTMTYDAHNNLISLLDSFKNKTTFAYDANNNLTSATNPLSQTVTRTYDANSLLTLRTSARAGKTVYTYAGGLPATITDANNLTSTLAYDAAGRLTGITDPAGKTRTMSYSTIDDLLTITDPLSHVTTFTYDSRHRKLSEANPLNQITKWSYDGNGDLLTRTDALGNVTRFGYDGEGRTTSVTDARQNASLMDYDPVGRLLNLTDAAGDVYAVQYDANGNVIQRNDARGNPLKTVYDLRNLPTSTEDALNRVSTDAYDSNRRLTRAANPLGQASVLAYDALDRLVQVADPLNQSSGQSFDADGNRTGLVNPRNATTSFAFDLGGRMTSATTAGNRKTVYTYEARNLVATMVDASNQTTSFTYDDARRLTRTVDPVGQIDYTYDNADRLLTVTTGGAAITRQYDALGRLTQFTDARGNVLKYAYDAVGNLVTLTYPDGKQVSYAYDQANRLVRVTDWASRITSYTYDPDGRLATTTRPNGTVETRTWDQAGQLAKISDVKGGTLIAQFTFTYDPAGRIVAEHPQPAPGAYTPASFTATYDVDNRLSVFNGASVTFDADGNMTGGPVVSGTGNGTYTYDSRNRLTGFAGVTYGYDAENRRVSLTDATGTTLYVNNPNARLSHVLTRTTSGGTVTRAVYGLGLLYEETGTAVRYYHYDYRGSAVAFTNATGSVIGNVQYGPYGELAVLSGDTATPFLFNGRDGVMADGDGLYHMRARYYHPTTRRFVNQDVVLGAVASGATLNRFAYANGNPVSLLDPMGMEAGEESPFSFGKNLSEDIEHILDLSARTAGEFAFRSYDVFADVYGLNKVGDLRGMVLSANARGLYNGFGLASRRLGVFGNILGAGVELAKVDYGYIGNQDGFVGGAAATVLEGTAAAGRFGARFLTGTVFSGERLAVYASYPVIYLTNGSGFANDVYRGSIGNVRAQERSVNNVIDSNFTGRNFSTIGTGF